MSTYFPVQHNNSLEKIHKDLGNAKNKYEYVYVPEIDFIYEKNTKYQKELKIEFMNDGNRESKKGIGKDGMLRPFTRGVMINNGTLWQVDPSMTSEPDSYHDSVLETDGYVGSVYYRLAYIPLVFKGYKETDPLPERAKHYGRAYLTLMKSRLMWLLEGDVLPPKDIFSFTQVKNVETERSAWKLKDFLDIDMIERLAYPKRYTPDRFIIYHGEYLSYDYLKNKNIPIYGSMRNIMLWRDDWLLAKKEGALWNGSSSTIPSPMTLSHVRAKMLDLAKLKISTPVIFPVDLQKKMEKDPSYWKELARMKTVDSPPNVIEWVKRSYNLMSIQDLKKYSDSIPSQIQDVKKWRMYRLRPTWSNVTTVMPTEIVGRNPEDNTYYYIIDETPVGDTEMALIYPIPFNIDIRGGEFYKMNGGEGVLLGKAKPMGHLD